MSDQGESLTSALAAAEKELVTEQQRLRDLDVAFEQQRDRVAELSQAADQSLEEANLGDLMRSATAIMADAQKADLARQVLAEVERRRALQREAVRAAGARVNKLKALILAEEAWQLEDEVLALAKGPLGDKLRRLGQIEDEIYSLIRCTREVAFVKSIRNFPELIERNHEDHRKLCKSPANTIHS